MNLFRSAVIAAALLVPFGPSATATAENSAPSLPHLTDSRALDLRAVGSKLVTETIEDALRQGGLALFGEGFQLDSSLIYEFGKDEDNVEGELDIVLPLLNFDEHAVFLQPGAVFWTGLEDEERADGNIGLVYRTNLTENLIGGISTFYDHDFAIGHSRVGGGIDLQSGYFRTALNYYYPLGDTQDGREGYIEDALQGGDARLVIEREVIRVGGSIGYWKFQGKDDVEDEWEFSYSLDAGFRFLPGLFLEGGWEGHDSDKSLGERWNIGWAFRFSLPYFEGASYGGREMSASLHKVVEREKRILYEEREAGPKVSVIRSNANEIVAEGGIITATIQLDEVFEENVSLNLIGSGTATYNDDYTVSAGGRVCPAVTEDNCQITIPAGQISASAAIAINEDGRGESEEIIILSPVVADAGDTGLLPGGALVINIPADPPLPTVSLSASSTEITEGGMATLTLTLNEMLEENATFNLIGSGGAEYGTSADWNLSVGGTDCGMASESNPCPVTISQGGTTAEVTVEVHADSTTETTSETFTVSVEVDSGSTSIVQEGSRSSVDFTIPADPPLPTVSLSASGTTIAEGETATITVTLSETLGRQATFTLTSSRDSATYGTFTGDDYYIVRNDGVNCARLCTITISQGQTSVDLTVQVAADSMNETIAETFTTSLTVNPTSTDIVQLGSPSMLDFTISAEDPLPTVSLNVDKTTIAEGETATITVALSEALEEQTAFTLTGSTNSAIYGVSQDYTLSHSGVTCARACSVIIPARQSSFEVTVNVDEDSRNETTAETFATSLTINSQSRGVVALGSPSTLDFTIPAEDPLPTVSWEADVTSITEGETAKITFTLSGALGGNATFNLRSFSFGRTATYGTGANDDWNLSVGGTDCPTATSTNPCQVTIMQGATTAEVIIETNADMTVEMTENITITVEIDSDSGSRSIVALGNSGTLQLTIEDPPSTKNKVGFATASQTITVGENVGTTSLMMQLSNADGTPYTLSVPSPMNFRVRTSGDTNSSDFSVSFTDGNDGVWFNTGVVSIFQGRSFTGGLVPFTVTVTDDSTSESTEAFTLTMELDAPGGVSFPTETWEIDPSNNTVTLTINDND